MMFCGFFEEASRLHETNPPKLTKEFQAFSGAWGTRPRWGVLSKSLHQPPLKFPPLQEAFRNIVGRLLEAWQRECLEDWKFLPCGDVFRACRQHTPNSIGTLNTWNRSSKRVERAWTCKYHICSGSSHRGAHAFNVVRFPDVSLFFCGLNSSTTSVNKLQLPSIKFLVDHVRLQVNISFCPMWYNCHFRLQIPILYQECNDIQESKNAWKTGCFHHGII